MAPSPRTPRQAASVTRRGRQQSTVSATTTTTRRRKMEPATAATGPPAKRRKFQSTALGGTGRLAEDNEEDEIPSRPAPATAPVSRSRQRLGLTNADTPLPKRARSTRTRIPTRQDPDDTMQMSSAAAVAAAAQGEGYKPREERGWEEFHRDLDIDKPFMVFHADDVDGTAKSMPGTPSGHGLAFEHHDTGSPLKDQSGPSASAPGAQPQIGSPLGTPNTPRRRSTRPSYFTRIDFGNTPKAPKVLPIQNQTPKERLEMKLPTFRKTDRILLFESKTFGQARYVEKAMMNVGYQESDHYIRPDRRLIKATDTNVEDEAESTLVSKAEGLLGRVEYDMDEQDDVWLADYNAQRKSSGAITREIFEITITKIEKEWYALEKRIPKPNPKPPQTHRPRSSSAAAVNGEPQAGEEQDSRCAICDDGDCENTNAIVFCDGCDLAVHQECYGVPFIPEGQWLCRKCQLIGRGVPTCIFCPNSDGAFKQTNSSKWAHLLCAMWIPEITLGNHTFMEPVMDVDKVPRTRWKLTCYICSQKMGACIQCGNKACYQAFHVTCARRAKLFLQMKNSSGALEVLDGNKNLMALCDKHCPSDHAKEYDTARATKRAKKFYKKTMGGRTWASSQASAMALAATHRNAITEHPPDESQLTGAKLSAALGDKKGQSGKPIWKLPSGAPVIPQAVYENVEASLQRFAILKRREFVSDACKYWTLKREMRRGAALLKRLQLQMETFSSMELTRRNFAAMGPSGKARLDRRIAFAETLVQELDQLQAMAQQVVEREKSKLEAAELEQDFVDTCYFPIHKSLPPILEKALILDKNLFQEGLLKLQTKVEERFYTTTLAFAHDVCEVIHVGINTEPEPQPDTQPKFETAVVPPVRTDYSDARDRKKLGKRILKSVQQQLESALRLETDVTHKPYNNLKQELESMIEASLELRPNSTAANADIDESQDVVMKGEITVMDLPEEGDAPGEQEEIDVIMTDVDAQTAQEPGSIEVNTSTVEEGTHAEGDASAIEVASEEAKAPDEKPESDLSNGKDTIDTPPDTNGYVTAAPSAQTGPPTPPRSNGSLAHEEPNSLVDGGIAWYLKEFEPQGTSAALEQWPTRETSRNASEELTEMDEEELNGLGVDFNDETITASPAGESVAVEASTATTTNTRNTKARRRKAPSRRR